MGYDSLIGISSQDPSRIRNGILKLDNWWDFNRKDFLKKVQGEVLGKQWGMVLYPDTSNSRELFLTLEQGTQERTVMRT